MKWILCCAVAVVVFSEPAIAGQAPPPLHPKREIRITLRDYVGIARIRRIDCQTGGRCKARYVKLVRGTRRASEICHQNYHVYYDTDVPDVDIEISGMTYDTDYWVVIDSDAPVCWPARAMSLKGTR